MKKILNLLLILIIFSLIFINFSFASTGTLRDTEFLNVRETPSTSSNIVTVLPKDASFEITGEEGDWYKIKYQDGQYYITTKKAIESAIFIKKIPANKTIVMSKKEFEIFLNTVNSNLEGYLRAPVAAEALRFWFDLETAQNYIDKGLLSEDTFKFLRLGSNSYYSSLNDFT